jgi:hypothetical protein
MFCGRSTLSELVTLLLVSGLSAFVFVIADPCVIHTRNRCREMVGDSQNQASTQNTSLEKLLEIQPEAFVAKFAQARCLSCDQKIKLKLEDCGRVNSVGAKTIYIYMHMYVHTHVHVHIHMYM